MGADQQIDWATGAVSVLDWWREAGVDVLVDDAPRDWLARTPPPPPLAAQAVTEAAPAALPDTIEAFVAWRTGPAAPEGPAAIYAEGDPAAAIMVVVDYPEGDGLIGGAAGVLFDGMMAAIGTDRAGVYLTTFITARPLGGRIAPEMTPRLAELTTHHIALVRPRRLLLLGQALSRAFGGTDAPAPTRNLRAINLENGTVEAVASLHPRYLLDHPERKRLAWDDLQLLMRGQR
ncbi:uracil-DNA glycosylase family protein [Sphingomonas sp.]|uniref:uracil-DNA glycosylase family protein n=1 Tax=Sphingomonas sp. TaxID=28214 RepID=UPI002DD642CB|nr:uracil-DNA glycosylase family protein [Sphingomonas sp.]